MTQQQLADKLGMARNTITRYERGFLPIIPQYVALAMSALEHEAAKRGKNRD